jgi:hypothetical protein
MLRLSKDPTWQTTDLPCKTSTDVRVLECGGDHQSFDKDTVVGPKPDVARTLASRIPGSGQNMCGMEGNNHGIDRQDTQTAFIDSIQQVPHYEVLRHMAS